MVFTATRVLALAAVAGLLLVGTGCGQAPEPDDGAKDSPTTAGSDDPVSGDTRMPSLKYTVYIGYDEFKVDVDFAKDGSWTASGDHEDSGRLDKDLVEEVAEIAENGIEEGKTEEGIECAAVVAEDAWSFKIGDDSVTSDSCAYEFSEEESRLTDIIHEATGLDLDAARKFAGE